MARHLTIRFLVAVWLCFLLAFALVSAPAPVFREARVPRRWSLADALPAG